MPIRITAKQDGFRRAGLSHPSTPTEYRDDAFTESQLEALRAEPMLVVEDLPAADPAPTGAPAQSPAHAPDEPPDFALLTKAQLVAHAKAAYQVELDPKAPKDALVAQVQELAQAEAPTKAQSLSLPQEGQ